LHVKKFISNDVQNAKTKKQLRKVPKAADIDIGVKNA
jgi:hypothetical protein